MIGEVSVGGVFIPALLLLALVALAITSLTVWWLSTVDAYRFVAMRPLVDLALYVVILWGVCLLSSLAGAPP
jgi:hypothetical protein